MEKQFELTKYGTTYPITLKVGYYMEGNLAIQLFSWQDDYLEQWSTLTVNLDGIREKDCAFIDINNNGEDILVWITRYGLAVPTGSWKRSGYCSYPEYRFKETLLRESDSEGYANYVTELKQRDNHG